jgi:hypothetical protein
MDTEFAGIIDLSIIDRLLFLLLRVFSNFLSTIDEKLLAPMIMSPIYLPLSCYVFDFCFPGAFSHHSGYP